jgi:hypothetical protein
MIAPRSEEHEHPGAIAKSVGGVVNNITHVVIVVDLIQFVRSNIVRADHCCQCSSYLNQSLFHYNYNIIFKWKLPSSFSVTLARTPFKK